jgi:Protein of unknown function (DUF3347)
MKILLKCSLLLISWGTTNRLAAQPPQTAVAVNKVIDTYVAVKDALVAGNGPQASTQAKALLAAIQAVQATQFDAGRRKTWLGYEPKLEYDSRHISEVDKVPHQREHFASLSANLYAVLKAIPMNRHVLYEATCTMTKQTFLSLSGTGKDPYMAMGNCNKVTAILPAALP